MTLLRIYNRTVAPPQRQAHPCTNCPTHTINKVEAADLLEQLLAASHVAEVRGQKALMHIEMPASLLRALIVWRAGCEDCEPSVDACAGSAEH